MKKKTKEMDTTVVTVDKYSFEWLMDNLKYSFPGCPEERKIMDYMAFYRTKPVSAVTHYGEVREVIKNADVNGKYRLLNFGDRARDQATTIAFDHLSKLKNPVKADNGQAIQGVYYTKMEYIKRVKTIPELWEMKK